MKTGFTLYFDSESDFNLVFKGKAQAEISYLIVSLVEVDRVEQVEDGPRLDLVLRLLVRVTFHQDDELGGALEDALLGVDPGCGNAIEFRKIFQIIAKKLV